MVERPWDTSWGSPVGVIKNERLYHMAFAGLRGSRDGHLRGWACYAFSVFDAKTRGYVALQKVPSKTVLTRLANKYLGSQFMEFDEKRTRRTSHFLFYINSGTKKENLAAFLAAAVVKGLE